MKVIFRMVREGEKIRIYQTNADCGVYEADTLFEARKILEEKVDETRKQYGKKVVIETVEMPNL